MYAPGYYKINSRALRFRELVRMHGLPRAFKSYLATRFMRPGHPAWMPSLWDDTARGEEKLSADFWRATKPHRLDFERLGFTPCRFSQATRTLDPLHRDSGGIAYLDSTRRHFGQLIYVRIYSPAMQKNITQIVIAFTAVFEESTLSVTNSKASFDPPDENVVVRLVSWDVAEIYKQFLARLQRKKADTRQFPDVESLCRWYDAKQVKAFEERVRRRLFLPMTEVEIAEAKAGLPGAGRDAPTVRARFSVRWVLWLAVIGSVVALRFYRDGAQDTLEYRGQQFKMRKAYYSYEDYKDDPNNLNTNELGRIEQAMLSASVPSLFKSRKELVDFVGELEFPGYGLGGIEQRQTDDGSTLETFSVEIPQREKDRVLVVREAQGEVRLVDDFIWANTNYLKRLTIEKQTLRYYDDKGRLARERHL